MCFSHFVLILSFLFLKKEGQGKTTFQSDYHHVFPQRYVTGFFLHSFLLCCKTDFFQYWNRVFECQNHKTELCLYKINKNQPVFPMLSFMFSNNIKKINYAHSNPAKYALQCYHKPIFFSNTSIVIKMCTMLKWISIWFELNKQNQHHIKIPKWNEFAKWKKANCKRNHPCRIK